MLRFRADGTFTIVQLTDLHLQVLGDADRRTVALVERVLDAERPDLVALTGDVVSGWECPDPERALRAALEPIAARGRPFALVFGNHDDEGSASRAELLAVARTFPTCLSEPGPEAVPGVGNFVAPVLGSKDERAALDLVFLDSHAYDPADRERYAWIAPEQIAWFREVAARGGGRPALDEPPLHEPNRDGGRRTND